MAASLFRMEAVEFQRRRAWSGATTALPVATWLLTGFFATSIAIAVTFLSLTTYGRKEIVPGYLTPATGVAKVMPANPGVVAELYVDGRRHRFRRPTPAAGQIGPTRRTRAGR